MLIFIAIVLWLLINYFTGGLEFYPLLCIFAGIFLIMPALLQFKAKEFLEVFRDKKVLSLNIILNFLIIPVIFYWVSYFIFWNDVINYAFLLLWLLPWWGLLLSWIMKTWGNLKIWFSLFLLNLSIFTLIFFPLNSFLEERWAEYEKTKQEKVLWNFTDTFGPEQKESCVLDKVTYDKISCFSEGWGISPINAMAVLIFFPFIISRFIWLSRRLTDFLTPKIKIISTIATFFVIWYIFSLKHINSIFLVDFILIWKIFLTLFVIYIILYLLAYFTFVKLGKSKIADALFWNTTVRFITLGLIFSFIYSTVFGIWFLLVFVIAYFLQIGFWVLFSRLLKK